jgi:hypothetical protein
LRVASTTICGWKVAPVLPGMGTLAANVIAPGVGYALCGGLCAGGLSSDESRHHGDLSIQQT